MAKKSSIVKNIRRQKIVDKFSVKRKELKKIIKDPKTSLEEKKFALKIVLCKKCGLSQLSIIPDTKFIFTEYDYLSSSSKALSNHYKKMIKILITKYKIKKSDSVLDIGCNDGVLLQHYPKNFNNVIGIEPSDASKHIKQKRIKLVKNFFNYKTSKDYLKKYSKPKIVTITNVLAQINNLNGTRSVINCLHFLT